MEEKLYIIKIGGNVIDDEEALAVFLADFAQLKGHKILVHGGGKSATKLSKRMGIATQMINGRRVTSTEELSVVTMVYAGLINKNVCAKLQAFNCNAIGLSGADANCIKATKRSSKPINYGWAGDVDKVNGPVIQVFLSNNMIPIFCAISHDKNGQLLNTNADTIAAEVAIGMSEYYNTTLVYCFEKKGVLLDINDENSVVEKIDTNSYQTLKSDGVIVEGMLPKMKNCFYALEQGVSEVIIGSDQLLGDMNGLCTRLKL